MTSVTSLGARCALWVGLGAALLGAARPAAAAPAAAAEGTFAESSLCVIHMEGSLPLPLLTNRVWWRGCRGKNRWSMSYAEFFSAMGRPDIGAAEEHRRAVGEALAWGGFAAEVGGGGFFIYSLAKHGFGVSATVGLGVMAGGLVASLLAGSYLRPGVSEDQANEMAERYNGQLRAHLGLPAFAPESARPPRPKAPRFTLAPALGPSLGGLGIAGAF